MKHPKEAIYELPRHHFVEAYKTTYIKAMRDLREFLLQAEQALDEVYSVVKDAPTMDKCDADDYAAAVAKFIAANSGLKESVYVESASLQIQNLFEVLRTVDKAYQILPEKVNNSLLREEVVSLISKP